MTSDKVIWASGTAYEAYIGRWSRLVAPLFLGWLGAPRGQRWLDVGCGTGELTRAILSLAGPISVIAVDPAPSFLDRARELTSDRHVRFAAANAAATGLRDAEVDVTVSGLVLNHVPDAAAALDEAVRVTADGGLVAAYVWDYAEGMQVMRRFWDAAVAADPAAAALDQGTQMPIAAPDPLRAAFSAAGLTAIEVEAIEIPTVFSDFDDLWTPFLGGTGLGPVYMLSLSDSGRNALRDQLRASLTEESDGSIHLTARAWAIRGRRPA